MSWSLTAAIEKSSLPTLMFSSIWAVLDDRVRRRVGDPAERTTDIAVLAEFRGFFALNVAGDVRSVTDEVLYVQSWISSPPHKIDRWKRCENSKD